MPSIFDGCMEASTPAFLGMFGETISVTPQGDVQRNISAIVKRETRRRVSMGSDDRDHDEMEIEISGRNNTEGLLTPKEFGEEGQAGDSYVIDGTTWYCAELMNRKAVAGMFSLRLKTKKLPDDAEG